MRFLLLALLLFSGSAFAGADAPSSDTTEVLYAGNVVPNTLAPLDPRAELSVKLSAGWWVEEDKIAHRVGVTFRCHGGSPAHPPSAVFLLGPWSEGDSRGIYVRGRNGDEHTVLDPRVRTVPGTDSNVLAVEGAETVHVLSRIILHSGALIYDEGSRFSVGDSLERLQGTRALLERCLRLHMALPGWYRPPPGTSKYSRTTTEVLSRMASQERIALLNACTTDGRPASSRVAQYHPAVLLATGHHAILAASPETPAWEWLALRAWYGRLTSACGAQAR